VSACVRNHPGVGKKAFFTKRGHRSGGVKMAEDKKSTLYDD
jgi:hypothetical protein